MEEADDLDEDDDHDEDADDDGCVQTHYGCSDNRETGTLEGETAGPDYGAEGSATQMVNGTGPRVAVQGSETSGLQQVERARAKANPASEQALTGLGATSYGATGSATEGDRAGRRGVGVGEQQFTQQPQQPTQQLQQPLQQPQQPTQQPQQPLQQPQQSTQQPQQPLQQPQSQEAAHVPPQQSQTATQESQFMGQGDVVPEGHLTRPALRLAAPRQPRSTSFTMPSAQEPLLQGPPPPMLNLQELRQHTEVQHGTDSSAESFMSARSQETALGSARSYFMSFGQMFQRRVVDPVFGAGRASMASIEHDILSPELRHAMAEHQARPSLVSSQHRRGQEEEGSSSSLNQEMVMDEVRRQVQLAMQGRDQEVSVLRKKNEELEKALVEANNAIRAYGSGGATAAALRDREEDRGLHVQPGGNLHGGAGDPRSRSGAPGLRTDVLRVPEGELLGGGRSERQPSKDQGALSGPGGSGDGTLNPRAPREPANGASRLSATTPGEHTGSMEPLHLLVQGMRQLQEVYLGRSEAKDGEMKVGTAELPMMPDFGPEAAVAYSDWLYEVEQGIGGLSDKASEWFGLCLRAAQEAYELYQMSDPLARLGMEPVRGPELPDPKWSRLERRVLTMMLDTLQRAAKDDAKTHRISTVPGLLFRLHVLYAPGSSAERAAILRQLDGVPGGSSLTDTVSTLRKWRRHLQRAQEMRVSIPDASILLRGIDTIATKAIDGQPDLKFRLSLTRTNLQLQYRPTLDGVMSYYNHVIAELQQAAPSRNPATPSTTTTSAGDAAKLKGNTTMGAGTGEIESPTRKGPNSSGTTKVPCKFFLADSGCTKGASCKFDHTFPSKEAKRLKCWFCGSTTHQQSSCPVKAGKSSPTKGRQGDRGATSTTSSSAPAATTASVNQTMVQHQQAILESLQGTTNSTATTASSTLITSTGATTGTRWEWRWNFEPKGSKRACERGFEAVGDYTG